MKKLLTFLSLIFYLSSTAQIITTVAGNGLGSGVQGAGGFSGDGGQATNAELYQPASVAIDTVGNLYIADSWNQRIRKVNTSGIITTIGGNGLNGTAGYSGDGGFATDATLNNPHHIILDKKGNIFFADISNKVRKINLAGIITTVAGNGITGNSGDGGMATNAELNNPSGIAIDAIGNLYIADAGNNRIRKVDTSGIIRVFAGAYGASGSGDGGQATAASIGSPIGLALDLTGNLYFTSSKSANCGVVRKINTSGIISTIAGNSAGGYTGDGGQASLAGLNGYVPDISIDAFGNVYLLDSYNLVVRKIDAFGFISTYAGNLANISSSNIGDGGEVTEAVLHNPLGICVDAAGNLYIADSQISRIRKVTFCNDIPSVYYTTVADTLPYTWNIYPNYSANVDSVRWFWGDSTSSFGRYPSHTYVSNGKYNICLKAYSPCGVVSKFCQNDSIYRLVSGANSALGNVIQVNVVDTAGGTTGIKQLTNNGSQITIYPNPNNGNFSIETNTTLKQNLQIFDVTGKSVFQQIITGKTDINTMNLAEGVYNLSLIGSQSVTNKRIVIVR